jgi:hypothetical protein
MGICADMNRSERKTRYRKSTLFIGLGSVCSAVARVVGTLWVAIPLLVAAFVLLVLGIATLVRAVKALPDSERRTERRNMWIEAGVTIVGIAAVSGLLLLLMY